MILSEVKTLQKILTEVKTDCDKKMKCVFKQIWPPLRMMADQEINRMVSVEREVFLLEEGDAPD